MVVPTASCNFLQLVLPIRVRLFSSFIITCQILHGTVLHNQPLSFLSSLPRWLFSRDPACLLDDHENIVSSGLSEVLRKHTYVGMADETLALLQHGTRLYLLNVAALSKDMFYQQVSRVHTAAAAAAAACPYLMLYSPHSVCLSVDAPHSAATLPDA